MLHTLRTEVKEVYQKLVEFINTVNITNAKILAVIGCMYLTALKVLFIPKVFGEISNEALGIWCGFLLSMAGVAAWSYKVKRNTSSEMNETSGGSADDSIPPPPVVGK